MKFVRLLLFNPITNGYLKQTDQLLFVFNRRFKSMIVDMFFIMSIFFPIISILIIIQIFSDVKTGSYYLSKVEFVGVFFVSLIYFALLNKDYYKAKSVAKRIYGYQIYNVSTNEIAHPLKCAIRNMTCIIWPIEAVFLLFNPNRRLGDYIAGTIVRTVEPESPESILEDIKNPLSYTNAKITLGLSLVFALLIVFLSYLPTCNCL